MIRCPKSATSKRVSEGSPINRSLTQRVTKSSLLNKALKQVPSGKTVAASLDIHVNNQGSECFAATCSAIGPCDAIGPCPPEDEFGYNPGSCDSLDLAAIPLSIVGAVLWNA